MITRIRQTLSRKGLAVALTAALLIAAATPASAQITVPVRMSARTMAMGGAGLLSSNPIEMAHFNPGALSLTGGFHLYIPMIQIGGDDNLGDLINYIQENGDALSDFGTASPVEQAQILSDINDQFADKWITMNVDPMVGLQMGKLGISIYQVSRANLQLTTQPAANPYGEEPVLRAFAANDLVANVGLGLQFGPFLHGGVGVRYMQRNSSAGITTFSFDDADGMSSLASELFAQDADSETGLAVDVGATMTLTKALAVGGVIRGLYSSSSIEGLDYEPQIAGGVRFKPLEILMGIPKILIRDITLEADIDDLTNTNGESYADKLQLGAEVKLPLWTAARIGLNRGHLTYGAGLHFLLVDVQVGKAFLPALVDDGMGGLTMGEKSFYAFSVGIGF